MAGQQRTRGSHSPRQESGWSPSITHGYPREPSGNPMALMLCSNIDTRLTSSVFYLTHRALLVSTSAEAPSCSGVLSTHGDPQHGGLTPCRKKADSRQYRSSGRRNRQWSSNMEWSGSTCGSRSRQRGGSMVKRLATRSINAQPTRPGNSSASEYPQQSEQRTSGAPAYAVQGSWPCVHQGE